MNEVWTAKSARAIQREIKDKIAELSVDTDPTRIFRYLAGEIERLETSKDDDSALRRLIMCISLLYQHRRFSALPRSEVKGAFDLARALLRAFRVQPQKSRLSFLHGDLHRVMGQIDWNEGRFWKSALELTRVYQFGESSEVDSESYDRLAAVIRLERLGMLSLAATAAEKIDVNSLSPQNLANLTCRRIRIFRLLGRLEDAEQLIDHALSLKTTLTQEMSLEVNFEKSIIHCIRSGDFRPMHRMVEKGGSHYHPAYNIEARFWLLCLQKTELASNLVSIEALNRRNEFRGRLKHPLVQIARLFDIVNDDSFEQITKIDSLIEALIQADELASIQHQLLVYGAALRWSYRRNLKDFCAMVLARYDQFCSSLTSGESSDVLGVLGDIKSPDSRLLLAQS
jgi:hypothetical protein